MRARRGGLRIVHLGKYYPPAPGGIEAHVRTLARAQTELGADVAVLCMDHEPGRGGSRSPRWSEEWDGLVRVVRLARQGSIAKLDICTVLPQFLGRLCLDPPDVVHLHVPNPAMLLGLVPAPLASILIVTYHSDIVRQRLLRNVLSPFEHHVLSRAACILCSSEAYAAASTVLARHRSRTRIVPFGIELDAYLHPSREVLAERDRLLETHGSPLWLSVGRLVYYKGLENAVAALQHVPGKLLVVGTGPRRASLERQAAQLGVAHRIVWMGGASDTQLAAAYQAATAMWFPSNARSEAFGLVQLEAMASGCPVINCDIAGSGVPWVSVHGETGLTVPVDEPAALAAAARSVLESREFRARLAAGARRRVQQEHDHRLMAWRTLALYEQHATQGSESVAFV